MEWGSHEWSVCVLWVSMCVCVCVCVVGEYGCRGCEYECCECCRCGCAILYCDVLVL